MHKKKTKEKKKKKISPSKQKKSKQRKFHQVKVTSPFLLNKIMATTNYRTVEEDSFYINYKTAEEACCKAS